MRSQRLLSIFLNANARANDLGEARERAKPLLLANRAERLPQKPPKAPPFRQRRDPRKTGFPPSWLDAGSFARVARERYRARSDPFRKLAFRRRSHRMRR